MRLLVPRRLATANAAGPWRIVARAGDRFVSFFSRLIVRASPLGWPCVVLLPAVGLSPARRNLMPRNWRTLPAAGLAAMAFYATVVACSGDDAADPNVELQVVGGIANVPVNNYLVRVTTPRATVRKPLHPGDQTSADNWTYFNLNLNEGDLVEIAVEDGSGNDLVAGQCAVADAATLTYARAFAFYFAPPNNYVNCADGFTPNM